MSTRHIIVIALALIVTVGGAALARQETQPQAVRRMPLPVEFPVVGNVDAVRTWHFARIDHVEGLVGENDISLFLRDASGNISQVAAPRVPLRELAFNSGWVRSEGKTQLTRNDYAERMVAVDVDGNGRLIAIASLEPIDRDRNKLRRAIGY